MSIAALRNFDIFDWMTDTTSSPYGNCVTYPSNGSLAELENIEELTNIRSPGNRHGGHGI